MNLELRTPPYRETRSYSLISLLMLFGASACAGSTGETSGDGNGDDGGGSGGANPSGGMSSSGGTGSGGSDGSGGSGAETGGTTGDGGTPGTGGDGSTDDCSEDCQAGGFTCCDGECINRFNDINNCGNCGNECEGDAPFCDDGTCGTPHCGSTSCEEGTTCCGAECCGAGQLCCMVNIGPSVLGCFETENGTCPQGCPFCSCADPDTPIATPIGDIPISDLRMGDLVYSIESTGIVVVPLRMVNSTHVENHSVLLVKLEGGRELRISPSHPLGDGRVLSELRAGDELQGIAVESIETVRYEHTETYDILPASTTGIYFASGVPIGSTLLDTRR